MKRYLILLFRILLLFMAATICVHISVYWMGIEFYGGAVFLLVTIIGGFYTMQYILKNFSK